MNVNAAAAAAAVGALHLPPALPHSSFNSYYDDAGMDEYEGHYGNLMNEFNAVGGRAPNELRQLASANPETSSLGYLFLAEAPNAPNHPGYDYVIARLVVYRRRFDTDTCYINSRTFLP